jgi:hypothetical protein
METQKTCFNCKYTIICKYYYEFSQMCRNAIIFKNQIKIFETIAENCELYQEEPEENEQKN